MPLEIESLGLPALPALPKPGSYTAEKKLEVAYMFPGPWLQMKMREE